MISESMDFPMNSPDKAGSNSKKTKLELPKSSVAQPKEAIITKTEANRQPTKLGEVCTKGDGLKKKPSHHGNNTAGQLLVKSSSSKKVSAKSGSGSGLKKEKKRYEEVIIDGVTINAFKTWEDLQDELNEQITANRCTSRNTDNVSGSHTLVNALEDSNSSSSSLVPQLASRTDSDATSYSTASNDVMIHKIERIPEGDCNLADKPLGCKNEQSLSDRVPSPVDQALTQALKAKELADKHLFLLQDRLKQDRKKKKHKERDSRGRHNHGRESEPFRQQDGRGNETDRDTIIYSSNTQNNTAPACDLNHNEGTYLRKPVSGTISHQHSLTSGQYRNEFEIKQGHSQQSSYQAPLMHPQLSAITRDRQPMASSTINYQQAPAASSMAQINTPNPQYFQQYINSQLYQQSRDSQHIHHQSHISPMNHSYVPSFAQQTMPHCSSLMAQSSLPPAPYNSPYTITDTIISRQTSIIPPPMGLNQIPGARYGSYPQPNALDPIGLLNQSPGYVPSATERSFMEFARSYASASNMSNFIKSSSGASSLGNFGMGSSALNPNLDRFGVDQRMSSGFNGLPPGIPDPMSRFGLPSYNIDTRSAINAASFYPPHPFR